jgi:hypothetical protein
VQGATVHARIPGPAPAVPAAPDRRASIAVEDPPDDGPNGGAFPWMAHLRERLTDLHASWSQATWYLFNEEGWR